MNESSGVILNNSDRPLVRATQPPYPRVEDGIIVILAISCLCLAATVVFQVVFWRHNRNANILMSHVFSLMIYYLAVTTRNFIDNDHCNLHFCYFIFMINYYFLMSAVVWMSVMSYDVWLCLSEMKPPMSVHDMQILSFGCCVRYNQYLRYSIAGWGIPVLLLIAVMAVDQSSHLQDVLDLHPAISARCWFQRRPCRPLLIFGYGPLLVVCVFNLVFFALTVAMLRQTSKDSRMIAKQNQGRQMFIICVKLFANMGIVIISTTIVFAVDQRIAQRFGYIMMGVQGILIFIAQVCKWSTFELVKQKFCSKVEVPS